MNTNLYFKNLFKFHNLIPILCSYYFKDESVDLYQHSFFNKGRSYLEMFIIKTADRFPEITKKNKVSCKCHN